MTGTRAPRALGLLVLASLLPCRAAPWSFPVEFRHGVASGDPTPTAIILWTRVTPREPSADAPLNVTWRVSTSASMSDTVLEGVVATGAHADYTAKVDAQFAAWNPSRYFFRFELGDARSPVGQFTLPPPAGQRLDALSFGVFSCADWKSGYFNAYAAAAARSPPLDFWLQLGDYLYEYAQGEHPDPGQAVRLSGLEPAWELVQLDDYRRRHALHRTDPDLQALSAAAPLVAVWDDHEIANDPWTGGAQNHQPDAEGGWEARKRAAVRAYHEWMPTRTAGDAPYETQVRSFRALQFGDLANLHVLESRLNARTRQARTRGWVDAQVHEAIGQLPVDEWEASAGPALRALRAQLEAERSAASASLLGPEQLRWLQNGISSSANASGAAQGAPRWQLVGQQTVVMDYGRPDLDAAIDGARRGGQGALADAWERALANITHASADASAPPPTYALYSADDTPRGPARPVDGAVLRAGRVLLAEGRFRIDALFDSWSGYRAERARLLRALGPAANAVIYSGDSHCAWAGTHAAEGSDSDASVAAEYATTSTTSYGMSDYLPFLPPSLLSAAHLAAHPRLLFADTAHRGWLHVSLSHAQHVATFRVVESTAARGAADRCEAVFAQSASAEGESGVRPPSRQPCGAADEGPAQARALLVPRPALAGVILGALALGAAVPLLALRLRASRALSGRSADEFIQLGPVSEGAKPRDPAHSGAQSIIAASGEPAAIPPRSADERL